MPEMVLPGVYIEVRPEALIVPGAITVGNIGIVGTARRGPVDQARVLSSYADTRARYGSYDAFDPAAAPPSLSLVRALEIAYNHGAQTVIAIRVATAAAVGGTAALASAGGTAATLTAFPGGWSDTLSVEVTDVNAADPNSRVNVTLRYDEEGIEEVYNVATGQELADRINAESVLVQATAGANASERPSPAAAVAFQNGANSGAASEADHKRGLDALLNENAHIIVVPGMDDTQIADELKAHVDSASTDKVRRDRIGVVGSRPNVTLAELTGHSVASDRLVFVAPGIRVTDAAKADAISKNPTGGALDATVALPGSYAAAAIAGMLSARSPHVSLTNKTLSVGGLERKYASGELEQLVIARVLALEERRGFRVVKGITTDDGAFRQITTRRIVDYAKFGVRSSAEPYIGLLNNDRVRKALKGSINGFLAGMVDDEMLISYELDVTATRDEEIRGIARVTMTLRPTFSIDYIRVVMFLG